MTMNKILLALFLLVPLSAQAQQAKVVASCGTVPLALPAGSTQYETIDVNGNLCTNASGGGGGGGAVTIANGQDMAEGSTTDAPATTPTTTAANSVVSLLKAIANGIASAVTSLTAIETNTGAAIPPGTNAIGSLLPNQSVNVAQFGGVSTATGQVAVSVAPVTATNTALVVDLRPDSPGIITLGPAGPANSVPTIPSSPYPGNATAVAVPVSASSGNVAAATAAATLAGAASKFTYLSGFQFTSSGSTAAAVVVCTITGIPVTKSYIVTSVLGAVLANAPLIIQFNPPLQSTAVNTSIVVSCPSLGTGNTNAVMTADGYQL
jgi:hypothetical protein